MAACVSSGNKQIPEELMMTKFHVAICRHLSQWVKMVFLLAPQEPVPYDIRSPHFGIDLYVDVMCKGISIHKYLLLFYFIFYFIYFIFFARWFYTFMSYVSWFIMFRVALLWLCLSIVLYMAGPHAKQPLADE